MKSGQAVLREAAKVSKGTAIYLVTTHLQADETGRTLRAEFHAKYPDWDQPLRVHAAATATYAQLQ